jgi:hypothetical protein
MGIVAPRIPRFPAWWPLLPALALFLLTLDAGYGTTPDSLHYLAAAEHLRRTGGFGEDFTLWPPLYPALLALHPGGLGSWPALLGRIGALATLLGVWAIGRQLFASRLALAIALLALVALPNFGVVFMTVWSETVYVPLLVWTIFFWTRHLQSGARRDAAAAGAFLALAMLTRHVGVVLAIAMALTGLRYRRELRWVGLACLPYAAWVLRTFLVSGTYAGHRAPLAKPNLAWQVEQFGRVLGHWLVPHVYPVTGGIAIAVLVLGALGLVAAACLREERRAPLFLSLFVLGHCVLTVWTASRTVLDVDARTLFPVFCPLLLLAFWGIDRGCRRVEGKAIAPWLHVLIACYALLWFSAPNALVNALV